MRLQILESGHGFGTKALFAFIRAVSRQPILDIIKLVKYRPEFYGKPMSAVTHEAMRGESAWSVGERELMAAVVAKANACSFCVEAHAAVARRALSDASRVDAVLSDGEASVAEPLRTTLSMLTKLTKEYAVSADDMRAVLAAGASREQVKDALAVAFAFHTITRLAEAFGFTVSNAEAMDAGAKYLLARGYR